MTLISYTHRKNRKQSQIAGKNMSNVEHGLLTIVRQERQGNSVSFEVRKSSFWLMA
jgi:hypothetical protein